MQACLGILLAAAACASASPAPRETEPPDAALAALRRFVESGGPVGVTRARAFAKERGIPPDLLVLTRPGEGEPEELYRADWPPVAYVVGRDGKILAAEIGYVDFCRDESGAIRKRFRKRDPDGASKNLGSGEAFDWTDELPFAGTVRLALESKK